MHAELLRIAGAAFVGMSFRTKFVTAAAMALLIVGIAWLVYATGGVRFAYLHLMYVPVVVSGLAFGVQGGVLAGVAAGLLLGPYMPQNTELGLWQETHNWMLRLAFFTFIGALVGTWEQLLLRHLRQLEWLQVHHEDTGLLNQAGLIRSLDALMHAEPDAKLAVS